MKSFVAFLAFVALVSAKSMDLVNPDVTTAFGYHIRYGIPLAERIKAAEEANELNRIVGGSPSEEGQFKYQGALLINYDAISGQGVCSALLISEDAILTAAHCWYDGVYQASSFEVVLGSTQLFSGGTRVTTSNVVAHENWSPWLIRNDVAVAKLPSKVAISDLIEPIALPSGSLLDENFVGSEAIASGFGLIADKGTVPGYLSHVSLKVITNNVCAATYGSTIQSSNICIDGSERKSTCNGDSGGPLAIVRDNVSIVIGVTSFGHRAGCQFGYPVAFARVTSFVDWIQSHM